jgi:hypothetical protein
MSMTETRSGFRLPWSSERPADGAPTPDGTEEPGEAGAWPTADRRATVASTPATDDLARGAAAQAASSGARPDHRRPTKFLADLTAAMRTAAEAAREQALAQLRDESQAVVGEIQAASATGADAIRRQADDDVAAIREWSKAEIARIREETDARIARRRGALEGDLDAHAADVERRIEAIQAAVEAFEGEMAAFFARLLEEDDPARFAALAETMPDPPVLDPARAAGGRTTDQADAAAADETSVESVAFAEPDGSRPGDVAAAVVAAHATDAGLADGGPRGDGSGQGTGSGSGDGVDRAEIMAALEAAADAVVAAEAAAESASAAEEAADLAETAAELLSSRIEEGDGWADLESAEAEAALAARMDAGGFEEGSFVERLAGLAGRGTADGEPTTTRLVVTGLVSVASIASFKRHLGRVAGVNAVAVSSGPDGEFVFSTTHRPDVSFRDVVPTLPGFGARVSSVSNDTVHVSAHDPESDA